MHRWGDEGVDWQGISDAAHFIQTYLNKRGIWASCKEKWGRVDVTTGFGSPTHPFFNFLLIPYQKWVYRATYRKALARWPHLRDEMMAGTDRYDLVRDL